MWSTFNHTLRLQVAPVRQIPFYGSCNKASGLYNMTSEPKHCNQLLLGILGQKRYFTCITVAWGKGTRVNRLQWRTCHHLASHRIWCWLWHRHRHWRGQKRWHANTVCDCMQGRHTCHTPYRCISLACRSALSAHGPFTMSKGSGNREYGGQMEAHQGCAEQPYCMLEGSSFGLSGISAAACQANGLHQVSLSHGLQG